MNERESENMIAKVRLFVERMRAIGGVPELCDLAWELCNENEARRAQLSAAPGSEVLCDHCAVVFCPHGDPLHFHHDGCPACADAHPEEPQEGSR